MRRRRRRADRHGLGRYYAMDRDKRWERTKLAYDAIAERDAPTRRARPRRPRSPRSRPRTTARVTDEFIKPIVIVDADGEPIGPMRDGDSVDLVQFPRRSRAADHARARAR